MHEVAQAAAACCERVSKRIAHRIDQRSTAFAGEPVGPHPWVDVGAEQAFIGINIPDAYDYSVVHQQLLYADLARSRRRVEEGTRKVWR